MTNVLIATIACLAVALSMNTANAQGLCAPEYPTRKIAGEWDGPTINVAGGLISSGVTWYHNIHGYWPQSWADVEELGLVQVELFDFFMNPIDPDDGSADSWGDIIYLHNNGSPVYRSWKTNSSGSDELVESKFVEPNETLSQSLANPRMPEAVRNIAGDQARQKQLALALIISTEMHWFEIYKGRYPASWDEFVTSGFSPVGPGAFNPFNGQPLRMDGGPDDFKFVVGQNRTYVLATDANGDTSWNIK
jgi:hypothetical protein